MQRRNGLEVKDALITIGDAVLARIQRYAAGSPFTISSVVVGNVQYPEEVATAVSRKLAATQELQRKDTEIEIERKERTKREVQAQGIANAMQIIRGQLSGMYIQHEAIEAQKLMVNSPNHTVVYIPSGAMGVPLTGTFSATEPKGPTAAVRAGGQVSVSSRVTSNRNQLDPFVTGTAHWELAQLGTGQLGTGCRKRSTRYSASPPRCR